MRNRAVRAKAKLAEQFAWLNHLDHRLGAILGEADYVDTTFFE